MKVTVTQEHIDNGERYSPHSCPIALAVGEDTSWINRVSVGPGSFAIQHVFSEERYFLPKEAMQFVKQFDSGKHVEPITFEAERAY